MALPPKSDVAVFFRDAAECRQELLNLEVLPTLEECPICDAPTSLINDARNWRCRRKNCRHTQTIFSGTFFEGVKIPCNQLLEFGYNWLSNLKSAQLQRDTGWSSATVANWIQNFQQLIELDLRSMPENERKIGGPGIIVQIDEAKFGKRKFNRGHRVEGVWVVGGVEITDERKLFAVSVDNRRAETLLEIIGQHVHPGSHIFTDCWAGYKTEQLEALGMEHLTVNHTEGFVDEETGVHTNNIEATWRGMKFHVSHKHMNRQLIDGHLLTYIWKRHNRHDLWFALLNAIKRVDYDDLQVLEDDP